MTGIYKEKIFEKEIKDGERFSFGKNWKNFLSSLNEQRIQEAEKSLRIMLDVEDLNGKSFVDIGCGSGLFSLAAKRLGATVHSFDYDENSVNCAKFLKKNYFPDDKNWKIECGSALDEQYLQSLGQFDFVYSWGVLHHTGQMWNALDAIYRLTKNNGKLFIAIYNDQGRNSKLWLKIKKMYCTAPSPVKKLILALCMIRLWGPRTVIDTLKGNPVKTWNEYKKHRGMNPYYDVVDWVGGYPFEVAKPEEIFEFCKDKGFQLDKLRTCAGGIGCNEFVFVKR